MIIILILTFVYVIMSIYIYRYTCMLYDVINIDDRYYHEFGKDYMLRETSELRGDYKDLKVLVWCISVMN